MKRTLKSAIAQRSVLFLLLVSTTAAASMVSGTMLAFFRPETSTKVSETTLTFAQRVTYQRAIEEVYWRHRIWPKQRPDPKPPLDAVMSRSQLENNVAGSLQDSLVLEGTGKSQSLRNNYRLRSTGWLGIQSSRKFSRNCLRLLGPIPLSLPSVLATGL